MSQAPIRASSQEPEPAWDIARLFPYQGEWEESDYLEATESTNRLVELADGCVEVLPMPKHSHQGMVLYLTNLLLAFASRDNLGVVRIAALRMRLWTKTFREPDVLFMSAEHSDRAGEDFWDRADLVMEVVSPDPDSHRRDWITKRQEYARAGIPEYWIVDPQLKKIVVLKLQGGQYAVHSEAGETGAVTSALLPGFAADAAKVWAAAKL
jgi:Uma2 family endonuclease